MKILLATSSFRGGGITSYAREVVNCFAKQHSIFVFIGDDSKLPFDRKIVGVYSIESDDCSIDNSKQALHLINNVIKPDVILNSNSKLLSLITPYINNEIRVVSVSHSLRYNEADTAGLNSEYADAIVALSSFNKKYLINQFKVDNDKKISIIYNFVEGISNVDEIIENKKNRDRLKIVFAGGTSAPKNPELIIKIIEILLKTNRNFEFFFLGNNTPTLQKIQPYSSVQQLFKDDERLKFTGRVPREEAEKISSEANIFLVPSRREGCPMAMIEAMRAGCIVITSDYENACQEMVENGKNGFIIPHKDIKGFANRILDIIDNHPKYYAIYDECYHNYLNRFSFDPWRIHMESIILTTKTSHKTRVDFFDEKKFTSDLCWLKKRMTYNKYHMLCFETLKSAIPLFFKYFQKKCYVDEK